MIKKFDKIIFAIVLVLVILAICMFLKKDEKADVKYLLSELEKTSELRTARINMTGVYSYKDEGIPIISRGNFMMVYTASVSAGIDLKKVKISKNIITKKIIIEIPEILEPEVKIDPKSIKFYDEKFTLFNLDQKEDTTKAIALAEEDAKKEALETGIVELANKQSKTLVRGLLLPLVPKGYEIVFK